MIKDDPLVIGEGSKLPPVNLTPQQEELCRRLDALNHRTIEGHMLSDMLKGAIFAMRQENRSNPDWIAQSAHSLREIIYLFKSTRTQGKKYQGKWKDAFVFYGSSTTSDDKFEQVVMTVHNKITDIAHHQPISIGEYESLVDEYVQVLLWALDRQVDVHKRIDNFLSEFNHED